VTPSPPVVTLSPTDVMAAGLYGLLRAVSAIQAGRKLEEGRNDLSFGRHIEGALGEMALAYWLGVPYRPTTGRVDTKRGDVGGCQVRATTIGRGSLIVRATDPETFPYALVLLAVRQGYIDATLCGWLDGAAAKDRRWWRERGSAPGIHQAAFFVPQDALRPMETLTAAARLAA
jgi:hypothetical protein